MAKEYKVNLDLLKQLVGELEASLQTADGINKSGAESSKNDYIVELAKAAGLAAGVMTEAALVAADIQGVIYATSSGAGAGSKSATDYLEKILGPLKGGGGSTN